MAIGACQLVCFGFSFRDEGSQGGRGLFCYYSLHNRCGSGYPTLPSRSAGVLNSSTQSS